ncbi:MAG: Flp pilus assembly protein CpaB [Deltaproteobacteria bacterium]|nr:Flp pilus assembly protein CpaB [Deltaproteobacteria bacterium]
MKVRAGIVATAIASVGTLLVWTYLSRFEAEASGGPRVGVLVALHTIEPGGVLRDEDVGERWIPQSYVESRAIRIADRQRVVNLRTAAPLQAQQVVMWTDIIGQSPGGNGVSDRVQAGMRAVTIHVEGRAQALVRPGDRVDVIATLPQPGSTEHRAGVVLLQNVLVLARSVDTTTSPQAIEGSDIVLSLTLQHSQLLAVANDKAKLSVALRAPDDVRVQEGLSDVSSSQIAEAEKKAAPRVAKSGPARLEGTAGR